MLLNSTLHGRKLVRPTTTTAKADSSSCELRGGGGGQEAPPTDLQRSISPAQPAPLTLSQYPLADSRIHSPGVFAPAESVVSP